MQYSPKIQAYVNQREKGKLESDKLRIVLLLLDGAKTIESFILSGFKFQTVTARLSDLEDEGIIYKIHYPNEKYSWYYL